MMKFNLFIFSCLLITLISCQSSYERTSNGVVVTIDSIQTEAQFYSPSIVRVTKYTLGNKPEKNSLSVIKSPQDVSLDVIESSSELVIKSESLQVVVDLQSGVVSYQDTEGNSLIKEKEQASFTPFNDNGESTFSIGQKWQLEDNETIYGLGILQNGKMSQRGEEVKMIQNNTRDYITYFQSVKGYGLFWDNYSPTTFKDDASGTELLSEVGDLVDYYIMVGGDADGVIHEMRWLTGEAPMFPLWTFGYWQSKERYKSQQETVGVVNKYRELGVPLDGIIQDWQYWGDNYHWNAMEFLNPKFPDPQKFVNDVHDLNAHMIISIWSSFGPETDAYQALKEKNMLMDFPTWPLSGKDTWPPDMDYPSGVQVYDAYNPEARDIYWNFLNEGLFKLGMDGWWMDSTEPDHLNFEDKHLNNQTYLGSFRKVRNAYPLVSVGGVYKHQRAVSSDQRVFILTRSAFAGQQRYGANTWTGDVVASWKALENQISAGLNFTLCGIPYWNTDIGGFFLWDFRDKLKDPEYRELYTRWQQFGAFTPMMRSHGADAPREIYQFGQKGDELYDAQEKFIRLRYSLLPYLYSVSWDVTNNQGSFTRPLMMDFAADDEVLDIGNEYLFGRSILVAPVTEPMYFYEKVDKGDTVKVADFSKPKSKAVYLPAGAEWYDFWTNEKIGGGQEVQKETPIDIMPLYVKAGSIIPMGPDVQYATEKDWSELEVRVYTGADAKFDLYEDDNDNYNYENGAYSVIQFNWDDEAKRLTLGEREGEFPGMLVDRTFNIVFITEDGQQVEKQVSYSSDQRTIDL